mmetsp:Transcript_11034/g.14540  ORF Transcript_11034/g.14540 Transcript_11034/m.14540 type:complete len:272 (+) Transcript_11034:59-874(+)
MMILPAICSILFLVQARNQHNIVAGSLSAVKSSTVEPLVTVTANKLLDAVCEHFEKRGLGAKSTEIEELIDELASQEVVFDPALCLNGPLYAVQYIDLGPGKKPPSWVKYTTKGSIAGQLYELKESGSIDNLRVINYAEIFQGAVTIKSEGGCQLSKDAEGSNEEQYTKPRNPFEQLFSKPVTKLNIKNKKYLKCPVDYIVPPGSSLSSSISLFGREVYKFSIKGEGTARVIYANKDMRIFEAPPTEENWEPRGIRTVQVRIDLVKDSFKL